MYTIITNIEDYRNGEKWSRNTHQRIARQHLLASKDQRIQSAKWKKKKWSASYL